MNVYTIYRTLPWLAVLALFFFFGRYIVASLMPFFIAFVLAGLIEPAVEWCRRRLQLPRPGAVVAVLLVVVLGGGYVFLWVFGRIVGELIQMSSAITVYGAVALDQIDHLFTQVQDINTLLPAGIQQDVQLRIENTVDNLTDTGAALLRSLTNTVLERISALPSLLVIAVVALVSTFFLSRDRHLVGEAMIGLAPEPWRARVREAQEGILQGLIGFLKGQLFLFVLTTSTAALGLWLIGSPYWLSLALFAGILDWIPVVGPGFLFGPWAGAALVIGETGQAFSVIILYLAMLLLRQILQPKILGDSTGIHPLLMLIGIYSGIVVFGVQGLFIGPVLVIIGNALWQAGLLPVFGRLAADRAEEMDDDAPRSDPALAELGPAASRAADEV